MIEIDGLTKRYGDKTAVDGLSFVVEPGVVTGFLGPNGAGKSTTMRLIAGLDRPTAGTVRVNGRHYPQAVAPMSELGILLDARSVHPGLSARGNLLALARTAGIGRRRVDEVIELAGLGDVSSRRAGGFSLGMGQRLGVAAALLGQPQTVVLDERLASRGMTLLKLGCVLLADDLAGMVDDCAYGGWLAAITASCWRMRPACLSSMTAIEEAIGGQPAWVLSHQLSR